MHQGAAQSWTTFPGFLGIVQLQQTPASSDLSSESQGRKNSTWDCDSCDYKTCKRNQDSPQSKVVSSCLTVACLWEVREKDSSSQRTDWTVDWAKGATHVVLSAAGSGGLEAARPVALGWEALHDSEHFSLFDSEPDIKYSADGVAE